MMKSVATEHEIASLDLWGETSVLLDTFRLVSQQHGIVLSQCIALQAGQPLLDFS